MNIKAKKFRADAFCYEKDTVEYLEENYLTYYIPYEMNASRTIALEDEPQWLIVMLGQRQVEVCPVEEPVLDDP